MNLLSSKSRKTL